jgi:hypothetical protein
VKRRSDRRTDLVVSYVDGEGKSGQYYASKYADKNNVNSRSIISPVAFSRDLRSYLDKHGSVAAIVIVDDIVATGESLAGNLREFFRKNEEIFVEFKIPVIAIAPAATPDGEAYVRRRISEIDGVDCDLRICELLPSTAFAFSPQNAIWENQEEFERARALCIDLGVNIYKNNPLGYQNQGLLVVFPNTCPNNSLPILHSASVHGSGLKWTPLFPRLTN